MNYTGKLQFNMNGDYAIYTGDSYRPISSMLNSMLGDEIRIRILDKNDKELFKEQGVILKEKLAIGNCSKSNLYTYRVNDKDLDSVLWEYVDKKITFILDNKDKNMTTKGGKIN